MKKTLILSVVSALALCAALFAYDSAAAQDYYDSYGGGYGFDSGYSYGFDSGYDMGSAYDSYGTGGYGFDSGYGSGNLALYDGSYYGYNADGCGLNCGSSYSSYDYSGCGSSCYGGGSSYSSIGCGSFCGGGFSGWGGFGGYYGGGANFLPPIYVPPKYTPPVTLPPVYVPPVYQPPTYLPPVYVPPTYNPPTYLPPIYVPPTYNPPPVYLPPVVTPPLVCSIRFSNFNPPLAAAEGQLWSYGLQSISTGSYSNQISYRLVSGPDGMIVMPNGQMAWTPAFNQGRATAYMVTVAAYNGSCENSQTFYITVADMNPVPPVTPPKPVCGCACTNTCAPVAKTCVITKTTVTTTCSVEAPVKPITPKYGVCPPDAAVAGATTEPTMPNSGAGSNGFGIGSAFSAAFAGLFGALVALLYSPWLLLAVIIVLVIMVIRAYQRTRSMTIAI